MDEQTKFYYTMYPYIVDAMKKEGIDTAWASITTPHAMIESDWGRDRLAQFNNFFGMKAGKGQESTSVRTHEGYGKGKKYINDNFLIFPSMEEGVRNGVIRLRDKFHAFEGEPSPEQYIKNINGTPDQIYFTEDPDVYLYNLTAIKNGKRAQAALEQYHRDEQRKKEAEEDKRINKVLSQHTDAIRVASPYPTQISNTLHSPEGPYKEGYSFSKKQRVTSNFKRRTQEIEDYNRLMKAANFQNYPTSQFIPKYNFNTKAEGGILKPRDEWDKLSMQEKAEMIKVAVKNGITTLPEIRAKYNEFAEGGSMDNPEGWTMEDEAKFQEWRNSLPENLRNTDDSEYDMRRAFLSGMQPELQPDGYYHLGSRDPQTGRILKAPHHPTYLEAINSDARIGYYPITDDKGITYTDTWKGNTYGGGSYLDIAKQHIRRNEDFVSKPMKDAPKGKSWRSVGYGFNDSGFFGKYKEGISKHYENGISKADAEKELDWILRHDIVPTLQRQYGAKWNEMNDNQKAAIIDTYYQRPASVKRGSKFHSAVMSGNPNAGNYLGVTGFSNRNRDRRKLFGSQYVEAIRDVELPTFTPVDFSDYARYAPYPELLENPLGYQTPSREEFSVLPQQPVVPEYSPEEIERQERRDNLAKLNMFLSMIQSPSDSGDNSILNALSMLTGGTEYSKGGGIHIAPSKRGTFTAAAKKHGKSVQAFASQVLAHPENYSPAMRKKANFARNASHWKHGLGGNLFSGEEEGSQKMQMGLRVTNDWKPFTLGDVLANAARMEQQKQALERRIRDDYTLSNDATSIANGRPQNRHLERRAVEGAKSHAAWEKEHPNLTAWSNFAGALPFAIASIPLGAGAMAVGNAAASTAAGQTVTAGLAPFYQAATGATIAGAPALAWVNAGLQSAMAGHGLSEIADGTFIPMTALELTPLIPAVVRAPGIASNLRPQQMRNHWYVAKPPIGYDGIKDAAERWVRGIASGKKADIDNPWWFNSSNAKRLQDYAFVPDVVQGAEREQYLQQFGEHALEARADAWRMHNLIPQKFNTFTPNPRHPGSFTDIEGIRRLKYLPPQIEGKAQIDFVNSVGGDVGVPEITNLGNGIPDAGTQIKRFGITTTSDWFDLHPFSRESDKLIPRFIKPIWNRYVAGPLRYDSKWMKKVADRLRYDNKEIKSYLEQIKDDAYAQDMFDPDMFPTTGIRRKIGDVFDSMSRSFSRAANPKFKFLKPLEEKMANLEVGDITGGKPFLIQYDIPFTTNVRFTSEAPGVVTEQVPGFVSENLLPQSVFNWKHGVPTELPNIKTNNNFDFLNIPLTKKSRR